MVGIPDIWFVYGITRISSVTRWLILVWYTQRAGTLFRPSYLVCPFPRWETSISCWPLRRRDNSSYRGLGPCPRKKWDGMACRKQCYICRSLVYNMGFGRQRTTQRARQRFGNREVYKIRSVDQSDGKERFGEKDPGQHGKRQSCPWLVKSRGIKDKSRR